LNEKIYAAHDIPDEHEYSYQPKTPVNTINIFIAHCLLSLFRAHNAALHPTGGGIAVAIVKMTIFEIHKNMKTRCSSPVGCESAC
jgi:hypothetical protein